MTTTRRRRRNTPAESLALFALALLAIALAFAVALQALGNYQQRTNAPSGVDRWVVDTHDTGDHPDIGGPLPLVFDEA